MRREPTHKCPGGCGRDIKREHLACSQDWYRLPESIRNEIWRAYRRHGVGSPEHGAALQEAVRWYRAHPIGRDDQADGAK